MLLDYNTFISFSSVAVISLTLAKYFYSLPNKLQDSPGIGDSKRVGEITLKYLSRAYAFIYVINTPNAGGLQQDRVNS